MQQSPTTTLMVKPMVRMLNETLHNDIDNIGNKLFTYA